MTKSDVFEAQFWRRRYARFRGSPTEEMHEPGAAPDSIRQESEPSVGHDPAIENEALAAVAEAISVAKQADHAKPRRSARSQVNSRTRMIDHDADKHDTHLTIATVHDLEGFVRLLMQDFLHLCLLTRNAFWDRALNRQLYYHNHKVNKLLLLAAVFLMLFGSFWGGIAILIAAFFWQERPDE